MTAVAFILDIVAALTEGLFQGVGGGLILAVFFHPVPGDGVPAGLQDEDLAPGQGAGAGPGSLTRPCFGRF